MKLLFANLIFFTSFILTAQERNFNLGVTGFFYNSIKKTNINIMSNKGISIGFEKRSLLWQPVHFSHLIQLGYWNNSVQAIKYGYGSGNPINLGNHQYAISSISVSYTPSFAIPFSIKSLSVFPAIGIRNRILIYSHANVYGPAGFIESNKGYQSSRHNLYRGFDHFSVSFSHPKLRKIAVAVEADNLLNYFLLDVHNGDFYRPTDARYNFSNISVRICYKTY
jgi:hypothetical protein